MNKPVIIAIVASLALISLLSIAVQLQYLQQPKQSIEIGVGEVNQGPKESVGDNYKAEESMVQETEESMVQETREEVELSESKQEIRQEQSEEPKKLEEEIKQEQKPREDVKPMEDKKEVQIQCIPSSQGSLLNNAELLLSKQEGLPGSGIQITAVIRSTEYSDIFKYSSVKIAWFKDDYMLSEWVTSSMEWDYIDDTTLEGRSIIYTRVPELTSGSGDVYILACFGSGAREFKELGYALASFKVTEKPKDISYYRVDSIDDLYKRMHEALIDRGLEIEEGYLESIIGDKISMIEVKKGSYMFIDAKQISIKEARVYNNAQGDDNNGNGLNGVNSTHHIGILACISHSQYLTVNDTIYCIVIGEGAEIRASLDDEHDNTDGEEVRRSAAYTYADSTLVDDNNGDENSSNDNSNSNGIEYIVRDDDNGVYVLKYTIKDEKEGKLSVNVMIRDESLRVSIDVIKMISITNYCVPWVERSVTIALEPRYGLPSTKVTADITIKILPDDEPTRWMYEYVALAWLDPANRLIDSEWSYYSGEDILSSRWKEPVKIIRWSEEDIYTGSAKVLLEVPNVNYDKIKLLVCFVHPTPNGGFMDMVAAVTTFHVTDKMVEKEEDEEESKTLPTQPNQQQQQISRSGLNFGNICGSYVTDENFIRMTLEQSGSSATANITVYLDPNDPRMPIDVAKFMYSYIMFRWYNITNESFAGDWTSRMELITNWQESNGKVVGSTSYTTSIPSANTGDRLALIACFSHPWNDGFMDMNYVVKDITVSTTGTQPQQPSQPQQPNQPTNPTQPPQESSGSKLIIPDFLCGGKDDPYKGYNDTFLSLTYSLQGSRIDLTIKADYNSSGGALPQPIFEWMYSYVILGWYDPLNERFIEWYDPSTDEVIRTWQGYHPYAESPTIRNWSNGIGTADVRIDIPSTTSDKLWLVACFAHPMPGGGFMDMNYVVKDITVSTTDTQPQQPNQPTNPTQPPQESSGSKLIIPDFLCGGKDDPYKGYNDTFLSLTYSLQGSRIDLTIKADYNSSGGALPQPIFEWMYSYVILGWYDPLNERFIEWYDPSTDEVIRTWQGYHPYAESPTIRNWSNGIGTADVRIDIPSTTSDKLWLVACFAHPMPGGGFMDMNYTVVEVRVSEHAYYRFSTMEEFRSILWRELVSNGLSSDKAEELLSRIEGIPEHGSIILQSKKGSVYMLALILPHDPPLDINDSIIVLVVYSSLDSTTTINNIRIYSINDASEEVIEVLNPDQEPFIWVSHPIQASKAGIWILIADFIHSDGMHSTIVNSVSVRFNVVSESI
jgi:hypothetical protein